MIVSYDNLPAYAHHVLVDGAFDPIHAGHIAYLNSARALHKGPLLCAVASDDQIRAKGREPLLPQESRVKVLEALCDAVYAKDRPTEQVIEKMAPCVYVKGADWRDRLPPKQESVCIRLGVDMVYLSTPKESSGAYLRAWVQRENARHLTAFEAIVQSQKPASEPWQPVTDYSFEARKAIEGKHPELIKEVFAPVSVLDVGCGPDGHLIRLLREIGVRAEGFDVQERHTNDLPIWQGDITGQPNETGRFDLVVNRECLEHMTIRQLRQAVTNLCKLSSKFIYVTTRFAKDPVHLLSVDTKDDLDPTHITMLNQSLLRALFVLEGAKRRADLEERMDWQKKGRVLVYEV